MDTEYHLRESDPGFWDLPWWLLRSRILALLDVDCRLSRAVRKLMGAAQ